MAERRLIDANALIEHFNALQNLLGEYCECFKNASGKLSAEWSCIESVVENAPAIDAVPVVRCKECKYHRNAGCPMRSLHVSPSLGYVLQDNSCDNGFCYMGTKMDGGAEK